MKKIIKLVSAFVMMALLSTAAHAAPFRIGHLNGGSQYNATSNLTHYTSNHAGTTYASIGNAAYNATSVADLAAAYDVLIMPWYVTGDANFDWTTRLLPYMELGGGILWEDPYNIGDLAGSGLTTCSSFGCGTLGTTRSLVSPFDANGAESVFHDHFGITAVSSDWDIFSTDNGGGIHGVYGEFGTNGGRMVLGISDNLYHAQMWNAGDDDHYQLLINELNWIGSGSVYIPPTEVPEPGTLALLGLGLAGIGFRRRKRA